MKGKSVSLASLSSLAVLSVGCIAADPFLSGELRKVDGAIESAQRGGAAENCPEGFRTLVALRDRAEKTYWGCDYWSAVEIAQSVVKVAGTFCPRAAPGASGSGPKGKEPVAKKGAPPGRRGFPSGADSDGDNVPDSSDRCPGTPAGVKVDLNGCWSIDETLFEFGRWEIRPSYHPILDEVVNVLKKNPGLNVVLEGHTDNTGTAGHNLRLSEKRAGAVAAYLVSKGAGDGQLAIRGLGFSRPLASNETAKGRAVNRRVEIRPAGQEPPITDETLQSPLRKGARE